MIAINFKAEIKVKFILICKSKINISFTDKEVIT